jgi:hypothetical protein
MSTGDAAAVLRAALDQTNGRVVGQAEPLKSRGLHALRMRRNDATFRSASSRGKRHERSSWLVSAA